MDYIQQKINALPSEKEQLWAVLKVIHSNLELDNQWPKFKQHVAMTLSEVGPAAGEFAVSQLSETNIEAGNNTSFQVTFTPTEVGERIATLTLQSNATNSPYTFAVRGEGIFGENHLAAPTLFSPNGGGNNEAFVISAPTLTKATLQIYSRKGGVVFTSQNINKIKTQGWDGTLQGSRLPTGRYIWRLSGVFEDGTPLKQQTGEVYLVR